MLALIQEKITIFERAPYLLITGDISSVGMIPRIPAQLHSALSAKTTLVASLLVHK